MLFQSSSLQVVRFGWSTFNCCSCTLLKSFALHFDFLLWEPAVAAFFFFHSSPIIPFHLLVHKLHPKLLCDILHCHCCICCTHMKSLSQSLSYTHENIQVQMHMVNGCDLRSMIPSPKVKHLMMPTAVALVKSHGPNLLSHWLVSILSVLLSNPHPWI